MDQQLVEQLRQRIAALAAERDQVQREAERRLFGYAAAIGELERLLARASDGVVQEVILATNYTNEGHISDLRKIIARFMGRDEPTGFGMTTRVIQAGMAQTGEWLSIDGGAMRIHAVVHNVVCENFIVTHKDSNVGVRVDTACEHPDFTNHAGHSRSHDRIAHLKGTK